MPNASFGNKMLFIMNLILAISLVQSNCHSETSLTSGQKLKLKAFTQATYIPLTQQDELRLAYTSLGRRLNNYLIEIQDGYLFDLNDIESCDNIPSYVTFNNVDDAWICFRNRIMILQCNKEWQLKIGCGTFLEIHRPFDTQVLGKLFLSESLIATSLSIPLINVCAGTYHIWFIYSTRIGKVIKNVKPIFVSSPSCHCS